MQNKGSLQLPFLFVYFGLQFGMRVDFYKVCLKSEIFLYWLCRNEVTFLLNLEQDPFSFFVPFLSIPSTGDETRLGISPVSHLIRRVLKLSYV